MQRCGLEYTSRPPLWMLSRSLQYSHSSVQIFKFAFGIFTTTSRWIIQRVAWTELSRSVKRRLRSACVEWSTCEHFSSYWLVGVMSNQWISNVWSWPQTHDPRLFSFFPLTFSPSLQTVSPSWVLVEWGRSPIPTLLCTLPVTLIPLVSHPEALVNPLVALREGPRLSDPMPRCFFARVVCRPAWDAISPSKSSNFLNSCPLSQRPPLSFSESHELVACPSFCCLCLSLTLSLILAE